MQPTMKFVMDTSKYWFKPSISREQGKRKHYVSGDRCPRNQVWILLSRPWVMANGTSREGEADGLQTSQPEETETAAGMVGVRQLEGLPGNKS